MANKTMTFRPTDEQKQFIDDLRKSGDFESRAEIIRTGIQLFQEQYSASSLHRLRQLIAEAEDSLTTAGHDVITIYDIKKEVFKRRGLNASS